MIKFILPAAILLMLMISSQALACEPDTRSHYCMVNVVYQGASSTDFYGRIDAEREIVEARAKADACNTVCEREEACVSVCVAEAEFPILRCGWVDACTGWWPPDPKRKKKQEPSPQARLCGELCDGEEACVDGCMARFFKRQSIGSEQ